MKLKRSLLESSISSHSTTSARKIQNISIEFWISILPARKSSHFFWSETMHRSAILQNKQNHSSCHHRQRKNPKNKQTSHPTQTSNSNSRSLNTTTSQRPSCVPSASISFNWGTVNHNIFEHEQTTNIDEIKNIEVDSSVTCVLREELRKTTTIDATVNRHWRTSKPSCVTPSLNGNIWLCSTMRTLSTASSTFWWRVSWIEGVIDTLIRGRSILSYLLHFQLDRYRRLIKLCQYEWVWQHKIVLRWIYLQDRPSSTENCAKSTARQTNEQRQVHTLRRHERTKIDDSNPDPPTCRPSGRRASRRPLRASVRCALFDERMNDSEQRFSVTRADRDGSLPVIVMPHVRCGIWHLSHMIVVGAIELHQRESQHNVKPLHRSDRWAEQNTA